MKVADDGDDGDNSLPWRASSSSDELKRLPVLDANRRATPFMWIVLLLVLSNVLIDRSSGSVCSGITQLALSFGTYNTQQERAF
jgi:hypothetical protein